EELQRRVDGRRRGGRRADTLLEGVDDLRAGTGSLLQDPQDRDSQRVALPRARAFALRPPPAPPAGPEGCREEVEGPVLGMHGALSRAPRAHHRGDKGAPLDALLHAPEGLARHPLASRRSSASSGSVILLALTMSDAVSAASCRCQGVATFWCKNPADCSGEA